MSCDDHVVQLVLLNRWSLNKPWWPKWMQNVTALTTLQQG